MNSHELPKKTVNKQIRKTQSTNNLKTFNNEERYYNFPISVKKKESGPIITFTSKQTIIDELSTKIINEPEMSIILTEDLLSSEEMDNSFSSSSEEGEQSNEEFKPNNTQNTQKFRSRMSIVLERSLTISNEVINNFNVMEKIDQVTQNDILRRKVTLTFPDGRKTDKTLLFDLDETLIHTINPLLQYPKNIHMGKVHTLYFIDSVTSKQEKIDIIVRPHAIELLQQMHPLCEIIIFTAGVKSYADCILDFLDINWDFIDHRLYRDSCVRRENHHVKDLRIFQNRKLENLIIVDNSIVSFASQLDNGIHVSSFIGIKKDKELNDLIPVLTELVENKDVRLELKSTYCMPELFKLHTNADLDLNISNIVNIEDKNIVKVGKKKKKAKAKSSRFLLNT